MCCSSSVVLKVYYTNGLTVLEARDTDVTDGLKVLYNLLRKETVQRHAEHLGEKGGNLAWWLGYPYMYKQKIKLKEIRRNFRKLPPQSSNFEILISF